MLQTTGSVPNRLLHLTVSPYSVCLWSVTVCTCRLTQVKKKEIIGLSQCYQFTTPPSGGIKSVVATNSETIYTTCQTDREVRRSMLIYRDDTEIEASIYFHFTRLSVLLHYICHRQSKLRFYIQNILCKDFSNIMHCEILGGPTVFKNLSLSD